MLQLLVGVLITIEVSESCLELVEIEATVTVNIKCSEDLVDVSLFGRREALGSQESECCLLEDGLGFECLEIGKCVSSRIIENG